MKYSLTAVLALCSLLTAATMGCGPAQKSSEFCDITASTKACDGKLVQVTGDPSHHPEQHPLLTHDKQQSYWDVNQQGQWIFVSEKEIDCTRGVIVTGTLDATVGPCDRKAQNKNQYCGTAIYVNTWKCK